MILTSEQENIQIHHAHFGLYPSIVVKSPGRINIIGDHTDYHQGYAMPATVEESVYVSLKKNDSSRISVVAADYNEQISFNLGDDLFTKEGWQKYIYGAVSVLKADISGFNVAISGNIPQGAGMSSSAALCCGLIFGLSGLFNLSLSKKKIIELARKVEIEYAGVNCGYMDQYVCMEGKADHCLFLDFLDLNHSLLPIPTDNYSLVGFNSNVPHDLGTSDYNERKIESETALLKIINSNNQIVSYRDLTPTHLQGLEKNLTTLEMNRARHIVEENQRVVIAKNALKHGRWELLGELITGSHQSLKNLYEVTCAETDYLVKFLLSEARVLGARQIGGGFGGMVLALVKGSLNEEFKNHLIHEYAKKFELTADVLNVKIGDGCSFI